MATAIRLRQLSVEHRKELSVVVVLEKGSEPGAYILSGAVMDPRTIDELPTARPIGLCRATFTTILGKYTVFAEGARGHLGKQVIENFTSRKLGTRRAMRSD